MYIQTRDAFDLTYKYKRNNCGKVTDTGLYVTNINKQASIKTSGKENVGK